MSGSATCDGKHLARSFRARGRGVRARQAGYAEAALDAVALPPDAEVLDLVAGTGKLTRQFVPRFARVFAVEPLEGMRAVLERVVPEAEALSGTADAVPLEDACAGAASSPRRSTGLRPARP